MSIPFTQSLWPTGRKVATKVDMPEDIEEMARKFISYGGWFECETLRDPATISLTACWEKEDGDNDIAIEVVPNGPLVVDAVARLVRKADAWLDNHDLEEAEGKI